MLSSRRRGLAVLLAATGVAVVAWQLAARPSTQEVSPADMGTWGGQAYRFSVLRFAGLGRPHPDSNEAPRTSTLTLLEDGRPLGPPHAVHADIEKHGRGRYSHWGNQVIFSAGDGSDPRTNGRRYQARYTLAPAPWTLLFAFTSLAVAAALAARPALARAATLLARSAAPALFAVGMLATLTLWFPIRGESVLPPPTDAAPGVPAAPGADSVAHGRPLAFERLVAPFLIVPSGSDGQGESYLALSVAGKPALEVYDLLRSGQPSFAAFLDADRIGGDGLVAYLPRDFADAHGPFVVSWRAQVTPGGIGLAWTLFGVAVAASWVARGARGQPPASRALLVSASVLGSVGAILLALDIAGLFVKPVPNDADLRFTGPRRVSAAAGAAARIETLDGEVALRPSESRAQYVARMNALVAGNVRHVWNYANASSLGVHVPPWSNYILWALGETDAGLYRYHYASWRRALARRAAMCSQASLILVGLLRQQGLDARVVQLGGHTVVTAEAAPGEWHILDPDLGVVVPSDLAAIERNPATVRPLYVRAYERAGYLDFETPADAMVGFYGVAGNHIEPVGGNQMLGEPWVRREALVEALKWILPAALLAGALLAAGWGWRMARRSPS